jgi:uncharacterized membrane protein YbhN (UPF0104 family)
MFLKKKRKKIKRKGIKKKNVGVVLWGFCSSIFRCFVFFVGVYLVGWGLWKKQRKEKTQRKK